MNNHHSILMREDTPLMTSRKSFVLALLGLFISCAAWAAVGYGSVDLDRAKDAMNRGDFRYAQDQFRFIEGNSSFAFEVRREAGYFFGFCCVRMSDPWGAINAYERFISTYDRYSDKTLIPDALYVLARTFEEVRNLDKAGYYYRLCVDRFPYSEFSSKSQDRLRVIGGSYPGGGYPGGGYPGGNHGGYYGVTPEIADMIDLAKRAPDSYSCDQMLLKAAQRARCGADFVAISKAARNQFTQSQIFDIAQASTLFKTMYCGEIVDLAKTCTNSYYRNQLLLNAANKCARNAGDFRLLMDAATDHFTKTQILDIAQRVLGNSGGMHYNISLAVETTPEGGIMTSSLRGNAGKTSAKSDPFAGFELDQKRVQRVTWFIDAVKAKTKIDLTSRGLSREDMSLEVVKRALRDADSMKKFEKIHDAK